MENQLKKPQRGALMLYNYAQMFYEVISLRMALTQVLAHKTSVLELSRKSVR